MELTSFSIIILLTVALTVFIESYRGKVRGLNKSAVTLGSLILSVIIASVIAYPISGLASQSFYEGLIESDGLDQIKMQFPSFDRLANAYITAIIAPVVFLILFWILRMIIAIVISVVYKTSLKRKKDDPGYTSTEIPWYKKNSSLLGGITGFFTGVILSLVILSPFVGTLKIADDATSTLEKNSKFISGITFNNAEFDAIKRYSDEWPTVSLRALGGDLIYNSVSMVSLDGQAVPLRKEIENIDLTMSVLNHTTEILRDISSISKDNVIILEEALEKLKLREGAYHLGVRARDAERLLRLLISAVGEWQAGGEAFSRGLLHSLLVLLSLPATPANPYYQAIKQLDDVKNEISVGELAAQYAQSREHFIRSFRGFMGVTPHRYRQKRRMDHARLLLADTDLPISRVAEEVGFSDAQYFSRIFKKEVGVSPLAYRHTEK